MLDGSLVVAANPLYLYGLLRGLRIDSNSVRAGRPATATVTLDEPAPAGGAVISLSSDLAAAVVPKTVTVRAGQRSATFEIKTKFLKSKQPAKITATLADTTVTAYLTVS